MRGTKWLDVLHRACDALPYPFLLFCMTCTHELGSVHVLYACGGVSRSKTSA